jgi:hypothetical protein
LFPFLNQDKDFVRLKNHDLQLRLNMCNATQK